jgi:nucleoside-diphosphate-sugar epimerase
MSSPTSIVPPQGLVLVTGVNGFIGSHIADNLLKLGYRVRGTVRSTSKADWMQELMAKRHPSAYFEIAIVSEMTAPGAFAEAIKGVHGIVHVAGDMSFGSDPNKVITPMVKTVRSLLQTAANEPSVKRFVFTSSDRAISSVLNGKEVTIDSTIWNEAAVQRAWRPAPFELDRIWDVYEALKTQTEQEVWKFSREEKPTFVVNSVLPTFNVGPILHAKQQGSTAKWIMDFWNDPGHSEPLRNFGASWFIDVEDTALLHIAGLTQEDVKDERLLGFASPFNFNSWLEAFRQLDSHKSWPADDPKQEQNLCKVDTTREVDLLKRFGRNGWTSLYESVRKEILESQLE